jgi:hypothetical protein
MAQCSHEEADTRVVVHVVHAICSGSGIVRVRTVDSDVIVILLGASAKLKQGSPSICGDGFGCIKKNQFLRKGKRTAWTAWKNCEAATEAFINIASNPFTQLDPRADTLPIIGEMCSFLYGSNRLLARIVETGCPLSNWTKKYEERDLTAAMSEQWQFTH